MEEFLKILLNALPEALGALIATGIIALLSYLFVKRLKKETAKPIKLKELASEPPKPEICSNLPQRTEFIGKEREKRLIIEALNSHWPLVCIDGIGGIGKTSLALEVVHDCLCISRDDGFLSEINTDKTDIPNFHGFIWTTAKDRELKLNDILDAIARTLDWPGIAQQVLEEKLESVRKLLQTKRYLLIVDNFETITDVTIRDFLLKIPEPSKALITSREQKLSQAWAVSIKGLQRDEALKLIRNEGRRLGLKSLQEAEDQVLLRLYQATGGAPLAIKWAVGQIKQKGQSLDSVLAALYEAKGDIFEEVFARSWSLLSDDAKKVLMVMPIFASSASKEAIEAVSDVHHFALDETLGQLVQMWMVEVSDELETSKIRYSVHPLTRVFAKAKLEADIQFDEKAKDRIVEYFLKFTKQNGGWKCFRNLDSLEREKDNIFAAIQWCFKDKKWYSLLEFINNFNYFLSFRGFWYDRIKCGYQAFKASKRLDKKYFQAFYLIHILAWTFRKQNELQTAKLFVQKSLSISELLNDKSLVGFAFRELGKISEDENDYKKAKEYFQKYLKIGKEQNDPTSISFALTDLGDLAYLQDEYDLAKKFYQEARNYINEALWLSINEAKLANIYLISNELETAKKILLNSLSIQQKYGRSVGIAYCKYGLAKAEEGFSNFKEAYTLASESNDIYHRLGMKKQIEETATMMERLKKLL